jgi:acetyl esterase/lipase
MKKLSRGLMALMLLVQIQSGSAETAIRADVVYGHKDGMALVYDVLQPDDANGAAVVYMVSGGWFSRWAPPEQRVRQFADLLEAGFTVIPVHHGSSPRYHVPDAYADVSRAIRHIRLHADDYGIDAARIGVTGGSAGGHLSLMLGLNSDTGMADAEDPVLRSGNGVAAVVAYYPPVDLRPLAGPSERFPALNFPPDEAAAISPILHVDPEDPPTLLIHGDADELVGISNSEIIFAEFQKHNVASDFITIPGAGHGFRGDDADRAAAARLAWFNRYLLSHSAAAD